MTIEGKQFLSKFSRLSFLCLLLFISGCASGEQTAGTLSSGETCQSVRGKLDRLLANGAQWKVEAVSAGRKISAADKGDAESYNRLLNEYLGAKCHVQ